MNVIKFYECLSTSEKKQLQYLLKKEKVEASNEMFVRDWIEKVEPSARLANILYSKYGREDKLISDITAEEFFSIRNSGQKTWCEFEELRG